MSKHALEARLNQIREEKDSLERQGKELAEKLKLEGEKMSRAAEAQKARSRAYKEAREHQRESFWGRIKLLGGITDEPKGDFDDDVGLLGGLFSLVTAATAEEEATEMQKRFEELEQEEARILDQLEQLEPARPKAELTNSEQREKIYEDMAIRKAEWERICARETDEDRLRRLKNIYDDADVRDEEQLRKLV